MRKKLKILEICPFSAGVCGVWTRVLGESSEFAKLGYLVEDIQVFSSNIVKGTHEYAESLDKVQGISVRRFGAKKSQFSENVFYFDFKKELLAYDPDIVITHLLHPMSFRTLKICMEKDIPCYLVTHAPFNIRRKFPLNIATKFFNYFQVRKKINKFEKIIAITKWELPYLEGLGAEKSRIIIMPNGIPEDFLSKKRLRPLKDVLFLGRIAPVKNLEILLAAAKLLPDLSFSIVGSAEKDYLEKLKKIIKAKKIFNVSILPPIYDTRKKIELIDKHRLFVLPSIREAMPQVILEAMSRGKIVIASETDGAKEIIENGKTGFIFKAGDIRRLVELIKNNLNGSINIQNSSIEKSRRYLWKSLIKLYPFVK